MYIFHTLYDMILLKPYIKQIIQTQTENKPTNSTFMYITHIFI